MRTQYLLTLVYVLLLRGRRSCLQRWVTWDEAVPAVISPALYVGLCRPWVLVSEAWRKRDGCSQALQKKIQLSRNQRATNVSSTDEQKQKGFQKLHTRYWETRLDPIRTWLFQPRHWETHLDPIRTWLFRPCSPHPGVFFSQYHRMIRVYSRQTETLNCRLTFSSVRQLTWVISWYSGQKTWKFKM